MKIQYKILALIGILIATFFLTLFIVRYSENQRLSVYREDIFGEFKGYFDRIIQLKGSRLEMLNFDYSYWDDMVAFLDTRSRKWATENIDAGLVTYKCDAAWVYKKDFTPVYAKAMPGYERLTSEMIPVQYLRELIAKDPFNHFFIGTSFGIMEVRTAPIQPSYDLARKTEPLGFFVTGRLWNAGYINEIAALTESKITLKPLIRSAAGPETANKTTMLFSKPLPGWDGRPIAKLDVEKAFVVIDEINRRSAQDILLISIFAVTLLLFISFYLIKWVNVPLGHISKSLEKDDASEVRSLLKDKSEFGELARVITASFEQKKRILTEIEIRKKAEKLHAESEENYKELFENSPAALWEVDATEAHNCINGIRDRGAPDVRKYLSEHPEEMKKCISLIKITNVNKMTLQLHKSSSKEEFLAGLTRFLTPGAVDVLRNAMAMINEGSPVFSGETKMKEINGAEIDVLVNMYLPSQPPGAPRRILVSEIDISNLKKTELEKEKLQAQLTQASKLASMGTLAGGVAHELNNPMTGILGFAQLMKDSFPDDDDRKNDITQIELLALRCKDIISTLLAFARQENVQFTPIDINEALAKTFVLVENQLKVANIRLEKNLAQALPKVLGNMVQLQQVFLNLIFNAVAAIDKEGRISISTFQKDNRVCVKIEDNGHGIPKDIMPKIFDPFFSTKPVGRGSGLGLSLVHGIISVMNGRIEVESAENAGASFIISLPLLNP